MKASFRLGRIAGLEVGIHYTWIFAFVLITWTLAEGFFPEAYAGWARATYWITAATAAILLFGSVLLHELAHSLVARRRGLPVEGITLFIFGGVSSLAGESRSAWEEFAIAIVGPLTSIVVAAVTWALWLPMREQNDPLAATLVYLAMVNGMVGVFNLLPGFPLDGGRVLRSAIWGTTGSSYRATKVAAIVGQGLAFLFIAFGVFQVFTGNILGGIWIAFIGWFLNGAADSSRKEMLVQETLRGVRVVDVMDRDPETTTPDTAVEVVVRESFMSRGKRALPVHSDGVLVGIVSLSDVKGLHPEEWRATGVGQIMTREPLITVTPDSDVAQALKLIADRGLNQVLVVAHGRVMGMLTRESIIRYLQLISDLGVSGRPGTRFPGE